MQSNYTNNNMTTLKKKPNVRLFVLLLSKLSNKSILYYKLGCWVYPLFMKNVMLKDLRVHSLLLTFKSMFLLGLKRDILRLNLFLNKLFFFWETFVFQDISVSTKLKATFLRSVFVDNKAKLQYEVINYVCNYQIFFSNIWFLFYFISILFKRNIIKYSKIKLGYSLVINLKPKQNDEDK